jgi:serine/threonine protein kinase
MTTICNAYTKQNKPCRRRAKFTTTKGEPVCGYHKSPFEKAFQEEVLGEGTYGKVVVAGEVCKKILFHVSDEEVRSNIEAETLFLKALGRCEFVVDCLHSTVDTFFMPRLDFTLETYVQFDRPWNYILDLYECLIHALQFMYANHIVHMDLKPCNVCYDAKKHRFVIIDFGRAQWLDAQDVVSDQNPVPCGAYIYDSPENLNMVVRYYKKKKVSPHLQCDTRHDLYSVGLVLLYCLMGRHAHSVEVTNDLAMATSVLKKINDRDALPEEMQWREEKEKMRNYLSPPSRGNEENIRALGTLMFEGLLLTNPTNRGFVAQYPSRPGIQSIGSIGSIGSG